ncbi:TadE/TadG family type IV pilus assembly protein [Aurantimonas sp. HBX-1]|uniref:TadE/TadG family type IV pilus assembly protein n=1 Tax=Aurantimonas sp. HBX-1 TaxID=2906072 RepID=UPI001F24E9C8|nr:TadE/TadG family type IV pilus assembly protein [Aurantimonas sp. HBX-1]UIJ70484.1 pilus assembly protein [Aurantimonas sp. HBX-1]
MSGALGRLRRLRRCERGSVAVEFAIISWVFILVSLGIIEFGRGLLMRNELSYVADLAARQILIDGAVSDSTLDATLRAALTSGDPDLLTVAIGTETVGTTDYRTVTITYPFTLLVPGLTTDAISLSVDRRVPIL